MTMKWKENNTKTIYDLKDNKLNICIHKIAGSEKLYLNCYKLNINDYNLDTTDFNEAVKKSQVIIMDRATELHDLAIDFAKNVHDHNEFVKY